MEAVSEVGGGSCEGRQPIRQLCFHAEYINLPITFCASNSKVIDLVSIVEIDRTIIIQEARRSAETGYNAFEKQS